MYKIPKKSLTAGVLDLDEPVSGANSSPKVYPQYDKKYSARKKHDLIYRTKELKRTCAICA